MAVGWMMDLIWGHDRWGGKRKRNLRFNCSNLGIRQSVWCRRGGNGEERVKPGNIGKELALV